MKVFFVKMQESGSDYICIDSLNCNMDKKAELAVRMSRRHTGIGASGLIFIQPSEYADCRAEIYNADGSRSTECIDGIRCAARYVYDRQKRYISDIRIETDSGIRNAVICGDTKNGDDIDIRLDMDGIINLGERKLSLPVQLVKLKDTHCVMFVENTRCHLLEKLYRQVQNTLDFINGLNFEIAEVGKTAISDNIHIKIRTWGEGTGEILSSSSAACAVSAAAVWQGYSRYDENIEIEQERGILTTAYLCDGRMLLRGPAEYVYEGVWEY